jgi:predicted nucleotidyltransferase
MVAKPRTKTGRELYYRYLPPNIPRSAIRRVARRIAQRFDPDKIILFGSFAYGTPHEWSDVDLLVIMPAANEINQSIRITLAFDHEFPLDLLVRTPKRLERRLADGDSFLTEVLSRGIVVYEKGNAAVAKKSRRRSARGTPRGSGSKSRQARGRVPLPTGGGKVPQGGVVRGGHAHPSDA